MNRQDLNKTVLFMIQFEPFFGHLLTGLNKTVTNRVDTMAVGYNPST